MPLPGGIGGCIRKSALVNGSRPTQSSHPAMVLRAEESGQLGVVTAVDAAAKIRHGGEAETTETTRSTTDT